MYRHLDATKVIDTINTLEQRINERFPTSGLARVCHELAQVANSSVDKINAITKPNYWLRAIIGCLVIFSILLLIYSVRSFTVSVSHIDISNLVQVAEAATNELVLLGAAFFFLITVETRIKRSRTLAALHELRSIAHVIDMHQLTKDPSTILKHSTDTHSSPQRTMSAFELIRYLDYCSEMLALTAKISALYAQYFRDEVVLETVNEIEMLTSALSRKVWQKIMILNQLAEDRPPN